MAWTKWTQTGDFYENYNREYWYNIWNGIPEYGNNIWVLYYLLYKQYARV